VRKVIADALQLQSKAANAHRLGSPARVSMEKSQELNSLKLASPRIPVFGFLVYKYAIFVAKACRTEM
jgi:hypothetical protein